MNVRKILLSLVALVAFLTAGLAASAAPASASEVAPKTSNFVATAKAPDAQARWALRFHNKYASEHSIRVYTTTLADPNHDQVLARNQDSNIGTIRSFDVPALCSVTLYYSPIVHTKYKAKEHTYHVAMFAPDTYVSTLLKCSSSW